MQWLGGMGIILFTLAVLPMLNSGGGIQLFNAEVPGITHDKLRPRISETAKRLWIVYLSITVLLIVLLVLGPMNFFDAVCHALTTTATGGYSTKQNSIAYWDSAYIEYVIIIFMLISGINFSLVYHAALGDYKKLLQDEETKWFLFVVLLATAAIAAGLFISGQIYGMPKKQFVQHFFRYRHVLRLRDLLQPILLSGDHSLMLLYFVLCFLELVPDLRVVELKLYEWLLC